MMRFVKRNIFLILIFFAFFACQMHKHTIIELASRGELSNLRCDFSIKGEKFVRFIDIKDMKWAESNIIKLSDLPDKKISNITEIVQQPKYDYRWFIQNTFIATYPDSDEFLKAKSIGFDKEKINQLIDANVKENLKRDDKLYCFKTVVNAVGKPICAEGLMSVDNHIKYFLKTGGEINNSKRYDYGDDENDPKSTLVYTNCTN